MNIVFCLDGRVQGNGTFEYEKCTPNHLVVKLNSACKEHPAGTEIIITADEITSIHVGDYAFVPPSVHLKKVDEPME